MQHYFKSRRKTKILTRVVKTLNFIKMKNLENLKSELNVIKLEERLEMVNIATTEVEDSGNGVCCCSDTV
jgi:hypothetical protein